MSLVPVPTFRGVAGGSDRDPAGDGADSARCPSLHLFRGRNVAFTVTDFHDLVRLLEEHPEWRAELRRLLLPQELLDLPAIVRRLAEAQERTEAELQRLMAAVGLLQQDVAVLKEDVSVLKRDMREVRADIGGLKGEAFERKYRENAPSYFGRLVHRPRALSKARVADLLDDAVERGELTEDERESVMRADLVMTGRRRDDRADVYVLAEISVGVGISDVERAVDRAAILTKLGRPVLPVVAGEFVAREAAALAAERGVWQLRDGTMTPPRDRPPVTP